MHSLKVLIADDEPIIRMDLRETLQEAGQQVVGEAGNGLQAYEMARRLKPDLVIMDIKMPKMDGLKSAKLISGERIAPVMLLTAFSQEEFVRQACENGVIDYLVKPLEPQNFLVAIQMAYNKHQEINLLKETVAQLREDLKTKRLVGRAKGLIMARENLTEKEALQKMQKISMAKGISIRSVAQSVITALAVNNSIK